MADLVIWGSAHPALGEAVARELGVAGSAAVIERFPDGEIHARVEPSEVRGADVWILQPTSPPAADHLLELAFLADACRRAGAKAVQAIVPYFAYARHERRARDGEPIAARVVADLFETSRVQRVVAVDLHTRALEGFFGTAIEHVSAVALLAEAARPRLSRDSVVVAPDLGAVRLAEDYARRLALPMAIVHKTRTSATTVAVHGIIGEVRGLRPVIVDDLISTGGTIAAAVTALLEHRCNPQITVIASHSLFVGAAVQRFESMPVERVITTDTVPPRPDLELGCEVVSVASLLAQTAREVPPRARATSLVSAA